MVFGGTGHYGQHIVMSLLQKGERVRVLTRNVENAQRILGTRAEIISGDITRRNSIEQCLDGAKSIIISISAFSFKHIRKIKKIERDAVLMILNQAKKAGISRLIYISVYEIRREVLSNLNLQKFGQIKSEIEEYLTQSDFDWTILGAAPSYELFFNFLRHGKLSVPCKAQAMIPSISASDVGEITAQAVLRQDLKGVRFRLTGPEALSFPEVAKQISITCGQPIRFTRIPLINIKMAALATRPFSPFLQYIYWALKLLNNFPLDLIAQVPEDHQTLLKTFNYRPTSFEMEIRKRFEILPADILI
jgi:uncharacterized protein YbjT (DUF2867 family)